MGRIARQFAVSPIRCDDGYLSVLTAILFRAWEIGDGGNEWVFLTAALRSQGRDTIFGIDSRLRTAN